MLRVVISGSVGGHSGFAYAVGYYLSRRGHRVTYLIPEGQHWIKKRMQSIGEVVELPLPRHPNEPLLLALPDFLKTFFKSWGFDWEDYEVIVSSGSNFSLVNAIAGWLHGLNVYDLEGESRILDKSLTSRILASTRIAKATFVHWPEQLRNYKRGVYVGPVYEPRLYEPRDNGYLLVLGGSMGFKELYDIVKRSCWGLLDKFDYIVMQTGSVFAEQYGIDCNEKIEAWNYLDDIHRYIAGARAVIAHFPSMTSMTVAFAYNKPLILVKNPHLKTSSNLSNAGIFAEKIGAVIVDPDIPRVTEDIIEEAFIKRSERIHYTNGALRIAEYIERDIS